ncbi:hypothetical protein BDV23DRAFT_159400 [Aspergillus alliaceus]|uniref:Uncharacterized protein n=1 Tax=Petromyces alliaceus TaxID=209559 RepID=A0A5N7C3J1_PETAA|nr:hypothetical protein BDV23DRAFT_159400 [Aspergillus alliaceus]
MEFYLAGSVRLTSYHSLGGEPEAQGRSLLGSAPNHDPSSLALPGKFANKSGTTTGFAPLALIPSGDCFCWQPLHIHLHDDWAFCRHA